MEHDNNRLTIEIISKSDQIAYATVFISLIPILFTVLYLMLPIKLHSVEKLFLPLIIYFSIFGILASAYSLFLESNEITLDRRKGIIIIQHGMCAWQWKTEYSISDIKAVKVTTTTCGGQPIWDFCHVSLVLNRHNTFLRQKNKHLIISIGNNDRNCQRALAKRVAGYIGYRVHEEIINSIPLTSPY